jgi:single-stranded-DNA-specific exonuclease
MAAGVRLEGANLDAFAEAFIEVANREIPEDRLVPCLKFDCEASLDELTTRAVQELESLAPFGPANPRPRIRISGLRLSSRPEVLGSAARHLSVLVRQGQTTMRMVAWNYGPHQERLAGGMGIDAVVSPRLSSWSGRWTVEPELEDLRILDAAPQ